MQAKQALDSIIKRHNCPHKKLALAEISSATFQRREFQRKMKLDYRYNLNLQELEQIHSSHKFTHYCTLSFNQRGTYPLAMADMNSDRAAQFTKRLFTNLARQLHTKIYVYAVYSDQFEFKATRPSIHVWFALENPSKRFKIPHRRLKTKVTTNEWFEQLVGLFWSYKEDGRFRTRGKLDIEPFNEAEFRNGQHYLLDHHIQIMNELIYPQFGSKKRRGGSTK